MNNSMRASLPRSAGPVAQAGLKYLSVCSGIEAATVAWHGLGWEPVGFSEIEAFPSAVLAHHYPEVPNLGDMTKFKEWKIGTVDLLVGGTPCQAFSVAGLRGGLADARGNLSLTFCEMADHFDPEWVLWENVPGVLSSSDNAFGCFLAGLSGASEPLVSERGWDNAGLVVGPKRTVAWRVLDAQFFGLAQRRRRVFVLAVRGSGNWAGAAALFPVGEGMFWNSPPRREARQNVAGTIAARFGSSRNNHEECLPVVAGSLDTQCGGGKLTHQPVSNGHIIGTITARMFNALGARDVEEGALLPVAHSLRGEGFDASEGGTGRGTPLAPIAFSSKDHGADVSEDLSPTLRAMPHHGSHANGGGQMAVAQPIPYDLHQVTAPVNKQNRSPGDPCHTLAKENAHNAGIVQPVAFAQNQRDEVRTMPVAGALAAEPGAKQQTYVAQPVTYAVRTANTSANGHGVSVEASHTLDQAQGQAIVQPVAFDTYNQDLNSHVTHALRDGNSEGTPALLHSMQVRRLTPVECERLQGFPDGYTNIPWRKSPESPDGPRYKALGNSMAVPCMRWLGERIQQLEGE